jgi:DNA-binding SARP family transcriptional activator
MLDADGDTDCAEFEAEAEAAEPLGNELEPEELGELAEVLDESMDPEDSDDAAEELAGRETEFG